MQPRGSVLPVLLLITLPLVSGSAMITYEYEAPAPLSTPWIRTNIALCDDPDETCIGGAVFPIRDRHVIASVRDDLSGSDAPLLLCVWNPGGSQSCTGDDVVGEAGCGTRVLFRIPFIPEQGVVYVYAVHVDEQLEFCFATRGTLNIDTF